MLDLHTHHPPLLPGTAVINCYPDTFAPRPGEYYSVGIHPWHVSSDMQDQLSRLAGQLRHPQVVAIGEAGLDKHASAPLALQQTLFTLQARLAEETGKPLIIHLVKALDELLALRRTLRPTVPWIIHGFRGKPQQAETLLHHGFSLSFGEHLNESSLRLVPSDRLFLETDESLLPIEEILCRAALLRGVSEEELRDTIQSNMKRLMDCKHLIINLPDK